MLNCWPAGFWQAHAESDRQLPDQRRLMSMGLSRDAQAGNELY